MRTITAVILALFFVTTLATAQEERVEETVTTIDSSGNTKTVKVVRIKKTEDISVTENAILINPLKFFFFYNLGYMRAVTPNVAIGGSIQTPTLPDVSGFGFSVEARFYPPGNHLRGFYVAPNISQNWLSSPDSDVTASVFTVGGLVGWQWFPGESFAIGLGIGVDQYILSGSSDDTNNGVTVFGDYEGTLPAFRFDIGYGW